MGGSFRGECRNKQIQLWSRKGLCIRLPWWNGFENQRNIQWRVPLTSAYPDRIWSRLQMWIHSKGKPIDSHFFSMVPSSLIQSLHEQFSQFWTHFTSYALIWVLGLISIHKITSLSSHQFWVKTLSVYQHWDFTVRI